MSKHIGCVGQKVSVAVTLVNEIRYVDYKFSHYGTSYYTYIMQDSDGNVYVWKTSSIMSFEDSNDTGRLYFIYKGDTLMISGTVKEHSEYKGVKQTVLTRCKYSLIARKPDEAVLKREQQYQSIKEGDRVVKMSYSQYKEHYSDCETISGSFNCESVSIDVIVRAGRMKNSGVRGKHFHGYTIQFDDGKFCTYRAVSEENAIKQAKKGFPGSMTFECVKIYW